MIHRHLGAMAYADALVEQQRIHALRLDGAGEDTLLTVEHRPGVLTGGRRARPANLLRSPEELTALGVDCVAVDRGGDWTWHGPGQLVAYPIVRLPGWGLDVPGFVAGLEAAMGAIAAEVLGRAEGLGRRCGYPGLWFAGPEGLCKLGAVGVHVRRFVTLHGLALNLDPEPWGFDHIVPCGLQEPTSSLARVLRSEGGDVRRVPTVEQAAQTLAELLPRAWRGELPDLPKI